MLSQNLLLKLLSSHQAKFVLIKVIPKNSTELSHFRKTNTQKARFIETNKVINTIREHKKQNVVVMATTFSTNKSTDSVLKAFIGLDVEYPANKESLFILKQVSRTTHTPIKIVKTRNGYHVFVNEVYDSDIQLYNRACDFIDASALFLNHGWVLNYTKAIRKSKNLLDLKVVAKKILGEVGHIESGIYTFFDLRYIARCIDTIVLKPSKKYKGISSHAFFRINAKDNEDFAPLYIGEIK